MKKSEFFEELKDILELDTNVVINEETLLNLDSLKILSIIAMIDENFELQFSADKLKNLTNVKSVIDLVGADKLD